MSRITSKEMDDMIAGPLSGIEKETLDVIRAYNHALVAKLDDAKSVLRTALAHIQELRDAWERGAITEHDGKGGTRSNRNAKVGVEIREALTRF